MKIIQPKEVKEFMAKGYRLIDIREDWEWEKGIIKGAEKITMDDIKKDTSILDKNDKYVIYCKRGIRSENIANLLIEDGFKDVISLDGGYTLYKEQIK